MPSKFALHTPPIAQKIPTTQDHFGVPYHDNYAWLRDNNWQEVMDAPKLLCPKIRDHLDAENAYTQAVMSETTPLQDILFAEMKGRIKDADHAVPDNDGPYAYCHKFRAGDQYGLYVRRPRMKLAELASEGLGDVSTDTETILLDADALSAEYKAKKFSYFDISEAAHSDDHLHFAYAVDLNGSERYQINVLEIESGAKISEEITNTSGDFVWASDHQTLFWVERDKTNRPCRVYRKNLFTERGKTLVYHETDAGFFVSLSRSDSGKFIEIICNDHTSSEVWMLPANTPDTKPLCISPRAPQREYSVHDHKEQFYILTNQTNAIDFKIMQCSQDDPSADHWREYIPHTPGNLVLGIETYQGFLVRLERQNALPRLVVHDFKTQQEHVIAFDEPVYALGLLGGYEFNTDWVRFSYSSPTTPSQVFEYNMKTREKALLKTDQIPTGHDNTIYTSERINITARDGAIVPVTLIYKSTTPLDGSAPCLLYGYGSYGITISASFRSNILSLVDRGFVYATAHIRGGMAKGYQWYLDGKLSKKQNSFNDFLDVASGLCDAQYTQSGHIILHGGSAGGLLVGAALNQQENLIGGCIAAVPFVDVLNTMRDDTLPLTPPEWPEWGNPLESKQDYDRILAYSPYDQVRAMHYPPTLITAGLTDPRVTYWEPAKWAAKLREFKTGDEPILLRTNMDAGHQGDAGRYASLKEVAFEYAFAITLADNFIDKS